MTTLTHDRAARIAASERDTTSQGFAARLGSTVRLWRRRIEERNALAAFSARDRADIGINETDVLAEINKPFWKA